MSKLNNNQIAFCDFYIELGNATEAYKRAYKSCKSDNVARTNSSRLLTKANIKSYIEERMKEIESERIAKAEEVLAFLSSSLRGDVLEEVVAAESDGVGGMKPVIVKKQLSAKDRIKAAELLGKRYALFTEKVDLDGNLEVTIIDDIGTLEDA
ncbi:terminase small subunit [Paraclostridium bifermentans]|uniref:terminase small subunit n=1 Tax=Paraclostridium bifermentans TaxID=1490 RepID=UPI0011597FA7|nr:terminase small subunit [Paraclostridium bifermentans]TQO59355.1 terminase small subunit [Paraclostridium bifermentans]